MRGGHWGSKPPISHTLHSQLLYLFSWLPPFSPFPTSHPFKALTTQAWPPAPYSPGFPRPPPPQTYKGMLKILKMPLYQTSTIVICNKINTIKIPAGYHHSCTTFRQHFYHSFSQTCTTPGNKSRLALEAVFG